MDRIAFYMNPRKRDLSMECPKLNMAPLFGSEKYLQIGFPDIHPTVSMWGSDTYITGLVIIGKDSAVYPGCNFNADARMPMRIGDRCSLQHVELHYSGFRMLPTVIGDDTFMSHLSFAHSAKIGKRCYILGHATLYDGAEVEDDCYIDGNSTILGTARLKSGWAYSGVVDSNTQPMCRTSDVVFGIEPKTGETLYIGGKDGVANIVNQSHLLRNKQQMQLVAMNLGLPEEAIPAMAVTMPHVIQTTIHALCMAALAFNKLSQSNGLQTDNLVNLSSACKNLCRCVRGFYEGAIFEELLNSVWSKRGVTISQVCEILGKVKSPIAIKFPSIPEREVIQELADLEEIVRWLLQFNSIMDDVEAKLTAAEHMN